MCFLSPAKSLLIFTKALIETHKPQIINKLHKKTDNASDTFPHYCIFYPCASSLSLEGNL